MYDGDSDEYEYYDSDDSDECIVISEHANGTTSAQSLGQHNGDPDASLQIIYENVRCYPEIFIIKELYSDRISEVKANPVAQSTM
ncbi:hypothetical protein TNCV_3624921 [Trichonephila clavipes]|nr:hypothetical protein TNCV_3624921 [Trichonephila clavipes]